MRRIFRRGRNLVSVFLAAVLLVTALPAAALADEITEEEYSLTEPETEDVLSDDPDIEEEITEDEDTVREESDREDAEDSFAEEISEIIEEEGIEEEEPGSGEPDGLAVSSLRVGDTDMLTNGVLFNGESLAARYADGVLTLYNCTVMTEAYDSCIHCEGDLIINVVGDCKIGVKRNCNAQSYGIVCYGDLTIRNTCENDNDPEAEADGAGISGSLTILEADNPVKAGGIGIFCNENMRIVERKGDDPVNPGSLTVISNAPKYSGTDKYNTFPVGINVSRNLTIDGATVEAYGSESTFNSIGLMVQRNLILNSGSLTGKGGKVTDNDYRVSEGIEVQGTVYVGAKGTLTGIGEIESQSAGYYGFGITCGGKPTICGNVNAKGSLVAMEWSSMDSDELKLEGTYIETPENATIVIQDNRPAKKTLRKQDGTFAKIVKISTNITKVTVTVDAVDRKYRSGDTRVELSNAKLTGVAKGDKVTVDLSEAVGTMEDDHAGKKKPVTVTGVSLTGEDAAKYRLTGQPENVTVNILKIAKKPTTVLNKDISEGPGSFELSPYIAEGATVGQPKVLDGEEILKEGVSFEDKPVPQIVWETKTELTAPLKLTVSIAVNDATDYEDYTLMIMLGEGQEAFTVDFDTNKHGPAPLPQILEKGRLVTEPEDPTADGFVFRGWYTEAECKNLYDFNRPVTKSFTLYAGWKSDKEVLEAFTASFRMTAANPEEGLYYNEEKGRYETFYTGSKITPEVIVTGADGEILTEGVDYSIKYSGNLNVSRNRSKAVTEGARAIISGKGSLSGMKTLKFTILPQSLSGPMIRAGSIRITKNSKASPSLFFGNRKLTSKDYSVKNAGKKYKESGSLTVTGKGNFEGSLELAVTVEPKEQVKPIYVSANTKAAIVYDPDTNEEEMKAAIREKIIVTDSKPKKGKVQIPLIENECYELIFPEDLLNAGKKTIGVIGTGNYTGTAAVTLTVSPRAVKSGNNTGSVYVENPEAIAETPIPYVSGGVTLGDRLIVKYRASDEAEPMNLTEGKDYKLSYTDNKAVSKTKNASYQITFIGNYKGTPAIRDPKPVKKKNTVKKYYFRITPASIERVPNEAEDNVTVVIPDVIYAGKAKLYTPSPVITVDGVTVPEKSYTVTCYKDAARTDKITAKNKLSLAAGEKEAVVYVTITGQGNYQGTIHSDYRVLRTDKEHGVLDINKAKVTIYAKGYDPSKKKNTVLKSVSYNGKPRKIDDKDIGGTVVVEYKFDGKNYVRLVEGKDYELCYLNNTKKGKAVLIIKGLRNPDTGKTMIGSKKKTFLITTVNVGRLL